MSKLSAKLEELIGFTDWDRIIDHIYLMIKEEDKLEKRNAELEEQHEMDTELFITYTNTERELTEKIRQRDILIGGLRQEIEALKELITSQVYERG